MRIAYVCADPDLPVFACEPESLQLQGRVQALRVCGVKVDLFAANHYGPRPAKLRSLAVHSLPRWLRSSIARERQAFEMNAALQLALELHGPFDAVYERYSFFSYAAMEFAQVVGIPGLLEVNSLAPDRPIRRGQSGEFAASRVAEWVFRDASLLLPASPTVANKLLELGVERGRIYRPLRDFAAPDLLRVIRNLRAQQTLA